jgi:hypothetical protein
MGKPTELALFGGSESVFPRSFIYFVTNISPDPGPPPTGHQVMTASAAAHRNPISSRRHHLQLRVSMAPWTLRLLAAPVLLANAPPMMIAPGTYQLTQASISI